MTDAPITENILDGFSKNAATRRSAIEKLTAILWDGIAPDKKEQIALCGFRMAAILAWSSGGVLEDSDETVELVNELMAEITQLSAHAIAARAAEIDKGSEQ